MFAYEFHNGSENIWQTPGHVLSRLRESAEYDFSGDEARPYPIEEYIGEAAWHEISEVRRFNNIDRRAPRRMNNP